MPARTWDCACGADNDASSPVCYACGRAATTAAPVPAVSQAAPAELTPAHDTDQDGSGHVALMTRTGGRRGALPPPVRPTLMPPPEPGPHTAASPANGPVANPVANPAASPTARRPGGAAGRPSPSAGRPGDAETVRRPQGPVLPVGRATGAAPVVPAATPTTPAAGPRIPTFHPAMPPTGARPPGAAPTPRGGAAGARPGPEAPRPGPSTTATARTGTAPAGDPATNGHTPAAPAALTATTEAPTARPAPTAPFDVLTARTAPAAPAATAPTVPLPSAGPAPAPVRARPMRPADPDTTGVPPASAGRYMPDESPEAAEPRPAGDHPRGGAARPSRSGTDTPDDILAAFRSELPDIATEERASAPLDAVGALDGAAPSIAAAMAVPLLDRRASAALPPPAPAVEERRNAVALSLAGLFEGAEDGPDAEPARRTRPVRTTPSFFDEEPPVVAPPRRSRRRALLSPGGVIAMLAIIGALYIVATVVARSHPSTKPPNPDQVSSTK